MTVRALPWLWLLAACGAEGTADSDADAAPGSGLGTLAVAFGIDTDWRDAMDEPAVGPFLGTVYYADEVSSIGPDDGATELADIAVAEVALDGEAVTGVLTTTAPLPMGWVTILGFLDSDGNADAGSPRPDDGDPVTLPPENEFEVREDQELEITVFFGFLNP